MLLHMGYTRPHKGVVNQPVSLYLYFILVDTKALLNVRPRIAETLYPIRMKIAFFVMLLFIPLFSKAQKVIDTTELFNGKLIRKQIDINKSGDVVKEVFFHKNGEVETAYIYIDNEKAGWTAYDSLGNKVAKWNNPEIEIRRLKKLD